MTLADLDHLVIRAQGGDRTAFHSVIEALDGEVRRFIAARASSAELIEEAVQSAFVTAYLKLEDYEPRGTFSAWIKGIARNHLLGEDAEFGEKRTLRFSCLVEWAELTIGMMAILTPNIVAS